MAPANVTKSTCLFLAFKTTARVLSIRVRARKKPQLGSKRVHVAFSLTDGTFGYPELARHNMHGRIVELGSAGTTDSLWDRDNVVTCASAPIWRNVSVHAPLVFQIKTSIEGWAELCANASRTSSPVGESRHYRAQLQNSCMTPAAYPEKRS
ncbi:predicted protein [Uncinocarpus reesii 1704]|uniref:Uncharacterized protein n=1 Tax=Uncinocarpus reesii (strain UAMH 1704) TaxID=336963 RepID=C4JVZ6_UNCRE|nr:uncharacterized protein UREG_06738 [Uncinocarpus reesii 1704]EEP81873.1 predicted protein [Uncinocarpus reesii 1704]